MEDVFRGRREGGKRGDWLLAPLPDAVFGSKPQIKNVLSNCPRSPNLRPQTHHRMQKYIDIKTKSYSQCLLFESRSASSLFHCPLSLSLLLNAVMVFLSYHRFCLQIRRDEWGQGRALLVLAMLIDACCNMNYLFDFALFCKWWIEIADIFIL